MPDAFDSAYGRLAGTRVSSGTGSPQRPSGTQTPADASVRWAASRLLPRLTALAPGRRGRLAPRLHDE